MATDGTPSYGGGYDSGAPLPAAPAVSGLGNFKGVMLCNRPTDAALNKSPSGGDAPGPFKSMISATHGEQLGLPPSKCTETSQHAVKKRGPSAALRQHVRWLRELQDQMRSERDKVDEEQKLCEEKRKRIQAGCEVQREAVRKMIEERDSKAKAEVQAHKAEAQAQKAGAGGSAENKSSRPTKAHKPLWAMTNAEKDEFEEAEADALINFAEGLDFDKYVGDLEFRENLSALKDRAGRLQKEQDAFKDALLKDFNDKVDADDDEQQSTMAGSPRSLKLDDGIDGHSVFGSEAKSEYSTHSRRAHLEERAGRGEPDWDSSTACGEDRPRVDKDTKDMASVVLESAPQIKAIHSKESIQRLIEKTKEKNLTPCDELVCNMGHDGLVTNPVITRSEDTQRLLDKKVDPSNLPYLYRSPAV